MTTHLYRFRPLKRLLDQGELLNQQIFFAGLEILNDPMEGFRDICWQGDAIVWENLVRHYILCLEWTYSLVALGGEDQPLTWTNIPLLNVGKSAQTPQHRARLDKLVEAFVGHNEITILIQSLARRLFRFDVRNWQRIFSPSIP